VAVVHPDPRVIRNEGDVVGLPVAPGSLRHVVLEVGLGSVEDLGVLGRQARAAAGVVCFIGRPASLSSGCGCRCLEAVQ
jgi:hypothetical protein